MKHLTEKELAERWKLTTRTLQLWRAAGKGPAFLRIGLRSVFYREQDVLDYEESCVVGKAPAEPEGWRPAMIRAASAFDLLASQSKTEKQKEALTVLRDEIRSLLG